MKMRKWVIAFGLLVSASANAAYFQAQTALPFRTQVSFTTYGGVCNGIADDTAAFLAFKAAWQGTTPVQLNLPAGICQFTPAFGSAAAYTFAGVSDLIVQGTGTGTTTLKSPTGGFLLGGAGQYQDNLHSVRTNDAAPGDSCVILKTQPAVTISAIANNLDGPGDVHSVDLRDDYDCHGDANRHNSGGCLCH
jgi:hypothetical protein